MHKGIKVARTAPLISHMLFADDSYIFSKGNMASADSVLKLLKIFKLASDRKSTWTNSRCFSVKNASNSLKMELCQKLRFTEADDHSLYLGLPNTIGRNKTITF